MHFSGHGFTTKTFEAFGTFGTFGVFETFGWFAGRASPYTLGVMMLRSRWGARGALMVVALVTAAYMWTPAFAQVSVGTPGIAPPALAQAGAAAAPAPGRIGPALRTADGRPNLQGIWQVRNRASYDLEDHRARHGMPAGRGVVEGGPIPYQPAALKKKLENFANRQTADPLAQCYMPGVPRIMYMEFPFQIFQTPDAIAMTFEWTQVFRLIHTNNTPPAEGIEFWMGDSRGRWDGDTFVVNVTNHNDKTWFDMSGNFHSEALRLEERYTLLDADTIRYEVTVEDPKVFTRPWKMSMSLYRHKDMDRLLEYQCKAEMSEANGAFEREPRTWFPDK